MMHAKISFLLVLLLAGLTLVVVNGCSLIGLGIGSISDGSKPNEVAIIPDGQLESMKLGAQVDVILKDGGHILGKYAGTDRIPAENFAQAYDQCREHMPVGVFLPGLGDSITVFTRSLGAELPERKWEIEFHGFASGLVGMNSKTGRERQGLLLDTVDRIVDRQDNAIAGETIRKLLADGQIPVSTLPVIVIQGPKQQMSVATDKIQQILVINKKHGKRNGLLIGAAIDVSLLLAVRESFKDFQPLSGQ